MRGLEDAILKLSDASQTAVGQLSASDREIHLWHGSLDVPAVAVDRLTQLLSDDERSRADRFHFELHRRRFIVRRAALRTVIARYRLAHPAELQFGDGPHGKPHLTGRLADDDLNFNATSSEERLLIAVTLRHRVGVDLEYIRPISNIGGLIKLCLSRAEADLLRALPATERLDCFYRHWTGKEACLKATGEGLSRRPDTIRLYWTASSDDAILDGQALLDGSDALAVTSFRPFENYLAAVACDYRPSVIKRLGLTVAEFDVS